MRPSPSAPASPSARMSAGKGTHRAGRDDPGPLPPVGALLAALTFAFADSLQLRLGTMSAAEGRGLHPRRLPAHAPVRGRAVRGRGRGGQGAGPRREQADPTSSSGSRRPAGRHSAAASVVSGARRPASSPVAPRRRRMSRSTLPGRRVHPLQAPAVRHRAHDRERPRAPAPTFCRFREPPGRGPCDRRARLYPYSASGWAPPRSPRTAACCAAATWRTPATA